MCQWSGNSNISCITVLCTILKNLRLIFTQFTNSLFFAYQEGYVPVFTEVACGVSSEKLKSGILVTEVTGYRFHSGYPWLETFRLLLTASNHLNERLKLKIYIYPRDTNEKHWYIHTACEVFTYTLSPYCAHFANFTDVLDDLQPEVTFIIQRWARQ